MTLLGRDVSGDFSGHTSVSTGSQFPFLSPSASAQPPPPIHALPTSHPPEKGEACCGCIFLTGIFSHRVLGKSQQRQKEKELICSQANTCLSWLTA